MKVTVLIGGSSAEREVSLATGEAIAVALEGNGYRVARLDPGRDDYLAALKADAPDLVFIALHGGAGEDGTIQAQLERLGLPYTGSGPAASRLAMDKAASKIRAEALGLLTPESFLRSYTDDQRANPASVLGLTRDIEGSIGYPAVAKPNREGSSVGLAVLEKREDASLKLPRAVQASGELIVERYIAGREMTVAILGGRALPAVEILPGSGLYDYEHKYSRGMSRYECPAALEPEAGEELRRQALAVFIELGCRDLGRVDFRMDEEGRFWFLEVNTIPGMTETSLVPLAAAAAGLDFGALVAEIARLALAGR